MSDLIHESVTKIIQKIIEQEIQDYLGHGYFERKPEPTNEGYRNGYESKTIKTAEGKWSSGQRLAFRVHTAGLKGLNKRTPGIAPGW